MEKIIEILSEVRPDVNLNDGKLLIDDGVLDSFDIIAIIGELNEAFDIDISVEELLPENFNTPQAMFELVKKLQEEA